MPEFCSPFCEICCRPAHGVHFGVASCRACAAFFRRNAGKEDLGRRPCNRFRCGEDGLLCKPCRLRKCLEAGMDDQKFQHSRGPNSTSSESLTPSFEILTGRPQLLHFCNPTSLSISFVNLTTLIDKASRILESQTCTPSQGPLRKLAGSLKIYEKLPKRMTTSISITQNFDSWENYVLSTATWLSNFPEFQEQEATVKMKILMAVWHIYARMTKLAVTALARRRGLLEKKTMMVECYGLWYDVDSLELDISWTCEYPLERVLYFLDGFRNWVLMDTVDQLNELDPSEIELTYMLAQLSFEYAGKRYQGEILKICERFQEILANDLHSYYVNDRGVTRYSERLARMMKINNIIQKSIRDHRSRTEIAKTFRIFTAEFSHPEMFIDTSF